MIRNVDLGAARRPRRPAQVPGRDAKAAAPALRGAGINVSLAPVADVPSVDGAAMGGRAFSRDPAQASRPRPRRRSRAGCAGGVAADGEALPRPRRRDRQHRPRLGDDPRGAPTAADLAPFKAAIAASVPLDHELARALPAARSRDRIASQSPAILNDAAARAAAASRAS